MGVVVWGAGGHGRMVADVLAAAGHEVVGFIDRVPGPGRVAETEAGRWRQHEVLIGIGDNATRRRLFERLQAAGWRFATAVHPRAIVHPSVTLGRGTVVMPGAIVNLDSRLGENCIVNTGATIDHDCRLGRDVNVAPGVHLAGAVEVEDGVLLGIGSVVIPGLRIGARARVGAGAVVVRHVAADATVVGVPARPV
ncbi:MAG: acetyltransferase [Candidatus Xenobia bacterium]